MHSQKNNTIPQALLVGSPYGPTATSFSPRTDSLQLLMRFKSKESEDTFPSGSYCKNCAWK